MDRPLPIPPFQFPASAIPRRLRGYDRAATESVFGSLAASYEQVWLERSQLLERVTGLESELERMRGQEPRPGDELVEARREAETVLEQARAKADELVEDRMGEIRAREELLTEELAKERRRAEEELESIRQIVRTTESQLTAFLREAIERSRPDGSEDAGIDEAGLEREASST